jgi:hypothetical protein
LRSTYRFGIARVPTALNLELHFLRLIEVALVFASWRVVFHCSWRNTPSPLRLACCARKRAELYRSLGRPPNTPSTLRSASPLLLAFLCALACCVHRSRGRPPNPLFPFLSLLFAHLPALRDIHEAPYHAAVLTNPQACDASRLRRLESSRIVLLFWGAWPAAPSAGVRPGALRSRTCG